MVPFSTVNFISIQRYIIVPFRRLYETCFYIHLDYPVFLLLSHNDCSTKSANIFSSYNAVDVTGQALTDHKVSNRKEVTDALTNLANEHNSLIARRIVQPNEKGEIDFRYQFYGHVSSTF